MKLSKIMHVASVIVGSIAVITFSGAVFGSTNGMVFGITKNDALLCTGILVLFAIWGQVGAIHHMMLEKRGEVV
ncbi:MAG: hypothetical protein UU16_C0023G0015 [Candidatus Woesebacteria bacterium GW2011_GWA2_40_7]|uniref:Uncharacterized protein n=3 Tax=Candidatus Woeseibacteriota TaxID=1752722 RepID=A0A0G0UXR3_9BACT|nr:MAG: hypothetical protein UT17_C0001G0100 [Candidatus Woesebacteria bacterium GW2011_GWB1_39_10]KKR73350.1 MAG: hypothetical protein UU16_C0023G0015 [Candidatus Woesebacteria bacterium GW2011_GWA2_40_7]KKR92286.1 MAG: hypothetical protein UU42_C0002G0100 [Candidatus Woesebacteria bacterium GW2011_GWA1_41_13b]